VSTVLGVPEVVADPDKGFNDQQVALYGKENPIEVPDFGSHGSY
jgi:hypothetical protein